MLLGLGAVSGLTPALWDFLPWQGRVGNPPPKGKKTVLDYGTIFLSFPKSLCIPFVTFPTKSMFSCVSFQQFVAPCLPLESSGEVQSFLLHFQFSKLQTPVLIGIREYGQDFLFEMVSSKFSNEFNALVFEVLFLIHSEFP